MKILDETGHPMMSDKEIGIIDNLIKKKKPKICLEWGSGNSTIYFPKKHRCIKEWIAIEHNRTYLELLGNKLKKGRNSIVILPNNRQYVDYPRTLGKKFDFILVDGEQRKYCMEIAFEIANKDAIILLHDACREDTDEILKNWQGKVQLLCQGEKLLSSGFYAHRGLALFKL